MQEGRPRQKMNDINNNYLGSTPKPPAQAKPARGLMPRLRQGLSPTQIKICLAAIGALVVLIVILLVFALTSGGDTPASSATARPASTVSSGSTPPSQPDSVDRAAFSQALGAYSDILLPETPDAGSAYVEETLFLGDSNTARMVMSNAVDEISMENAIGIESMGITSVLGLRCVRFSGLADMTIPKAVALMQPRRIVINFGTNNAGLNTDSFIDSYRTAVETIQENWPYADIFIASVFPITQNCTYGGITMAHIEEFNTALLALAEDMDLRFLNWSDALVDPANGYCQPTFMTGDGVHLSDAGLEAVTAYFRTHSFEGEDIRPKPLEPIPNRLPTPEGLFPKPAPSSQASPSSSSLVSSVSSMPVVTTVTVPDYTNAGGWTVSYVTVPNDGSYTEGQFISQSPAAGTQATAVGTITVNVAGPPVPPPPTTVTVPDYTNPGSWAVVTVEVANDGSYTQGQVLGQSPAAGTQATAVGTITVNVAGPPPAPPSPPPSDGGDPGTAGTDPGTGGTDPGTGGATTPEVIPE